MSFLAKFATLAVVQAAILSLKLPKIDVEALFGLALPCSSTKPLTGHALGAAGAIEAAIAWLAVTGEGRLPVHHDDGQRDPALPPITLVAPGQRLAAAPRHVMSNSFAFGGNNASLIFSHA